jgi:hypothetical protein|tara:strand:- start:7599 stop:7769 length:171 start_codon:yes stop_codon:yes gene_type:complete
MLEQNVSALANRIRIFKPEVVACVFKKIERYIRRAIAQSGRQSKFYALPASGGSTG